MKQNQSPLKTAQQYYDRAREHFYEEEFDKAEADCTEAILRDEKFRHAWVLRGNIYSETGKYDLAVENFMQGLSLLSTEPHFMPGERSYLKALILCNIANVNLAQRNLEEAIRNSNKSAELTENYTTIKDFSEPWYIQGKAWLEKGNLKEALSCFDSAIAKCTYEFYHLESLLERARILRQLWKADQALGDCNRVIQRNPHHADALVERVHCRIAENLKSSREDIEDLRKAVRSSPKHPEAWMMLAYCLSSNGRIEEAGEAAAKALELNSGNEERAGRLGSILEKSRRKKEAREKSLANYHTFVRSYPDAKIFSHKKNAPIGEEEFDEAIIKMNRNLLFNPNDLIDRSKRAAAWIGKGNLEKALEDLNKLVGLRPDSGVFPKMAELVKFLGV